MRLSNVLRTAFFAASIAVPAAAIAGQPAPWEKGYEYDSKPNPRNIDVWSCLTSDRDEHCNTRHFRATPAELRSTIAKACEPKRVFPDRLAQVAQARVAYPDKRPVEYIDCS